MQASGRSVMRVAALAGVLLLGGCESLPNLSQMMPSFPSFPGLGALPDFKIWQRFSGEHKCASVDEADIRQVNWTRVPEVNMRVRGGEFEPMIVQLKQGWPYIFRIRNRDDRARSFSASDFFTSQAVVRITIAGERQDDTCVNKIVVPPRETAELRLVAALDGRYEFEDTVLPVTGLFSQGASGLIIVEERFGVRYQ